MNLLAHEVEQLVDHMQRRPDIWSTHKTNIWQRSSQDDDPLMGMIIIPPKQTGPFRLYTLKIIPLNWPSADCDVYIEALCQSWTEYGQRIRYARILEECGEPKDKAAKLATVLCVSDNRTIPDVDKSPFPTNRKLWPDTSDAGFIVTHDVRFGREYPIVGGGWLGLRLEGGMLKTRASLRSDIRFGGGYGGVLEGYLRPIGGDVEVTAAHLFGNSVGISAWDKAEIDRLNAHLQLSIPDREVVERGSPVNVLEGPDVSGGDPVQGESGEHLPEPE